jgi:hypothetical protein
LLKESAEGLNLVGRFRNRLRPQAGSDAFFGQDLFHLSPAHARQGCSSGEGNPAAPVAVDGELDPGFGSSAKQMAQSSLEGLFFAVIEMSLDKFS